jgi:hypothetical protein
MPHPLGSSFIDSRFDNIFKTIVSSEWCVRSDGNVESNTGYFSITEIPDHTGERGQFAELFDADELATFEDLKSGWYITVENNQGLIFVYPQATEKVAWRQYNDLNKEYGEWELAEDEEE